MHEMYNNCEQSSFRSLSIEPLLTFPSLVFPIKKNPSFEIPSYEYEPSLLLFQLK